MNAPACLTERLRLRTYHAGLVVNRHIAWLNDPEVVKYSEQRHQTHTVESQHSYLNNLWRTQGSSIWLIGLSDGRQLGTISSHIDIPNQVADMGIMIGEKDEWGKGYGLEAWNAVMSILRAANVRKIEAGCMESNEGMHRLLTKAGFYQEAIRRDHFLLDGKPEDMMLYRWPAG